MMQSNPAFESLYSGKIVPALAAAESVRKKILLNYTIIGTVAFAGFIFEAITWMAVGVAVIILFIIVYTNWYSIPVSRFDKLYEDAIQKPIISDLSPGLTIDKNSHLSLKELQEGLLVNGHPQYFGGNFLISGTVAGQSVRISEIHSSSKTMSAAGNEKRRYEFNGIAAISPVTTDVKVPIIICTNNPQREIVSGYKLQPLPGHELSVYYADESEFKKYVPVKLMENINSFSQETNQEIIFTITQSGIHIAIPRPTHYLRPNVFKSSFTKSAAGTLHRDLTFLIENILVTVNKGEKNLPVN